jgi:hypothetical protein
VREQGQLQSSIEDIWLNSLNRRRNNDWHLTATTEHGKLRAAELLRSQTASSWNQKRWTRYVINGYESSPEILSLYWMKLRRNQPIPRGVSPIDAKDG